MKILTVLGARPQFIKAGSVSREIGRHKEIREVIVHTGQHYDTNMSDIFFEQMQIPTPNYFLGIGGNSHAAMTGQMMEKIEQTIIAEKPDWVMVYGDTNSTLAAALVAVKMHIKLAHVESGLRSFNMSMPEEINRILTDRVSTILFCPTKTAVQNLRNEGFPFVLADGKQQLIVNVGDVMQDGIMFYKNIAKQPSLPNNQKPLIGEYILCTVHRAENTDNIDRLTSIFYALNEIAKNTQVIIPLHPRTKKIIEKARIDTSRLTVIDPIGYLDMVWLIDNCRLVMTDSGGLQKEAYFLLKPCITLRDETEWTELVQIGANRLAGADKDKIMDAYNEARPLSAQDNLQSLFGNGQASVNIIKQILNY